MITNNGLANRAGSELYVRDLATALLERGHCPVAFSTSLGDVARELRLATVPVIDDLDSLSAQPDVIHGQHHLETMMALLKFPNTPAIYFCHGWLPWEEAAPRFPRILRYVAVDYTCRDRLLFENAIPEGRLRVLLNFVDLERFRPRSPLPSRPERALIFSNNAHEHTHVKAVREACNRAGIKVDILGLTSGNVCAQPEKVLGEYDIVFAKARAALEAMAVGAAVVLCDATGAGPMVTTRNLDRLRPLNFGIRALCEPVNSEVLSREIAHYDADDARRVAEQVRATAARESAVDEILSLYREAIVEFEGFERDLVAEERAAADYLRWLSPRLKGLDQELYAAKTQLTEATLELDRANTRVSDTLVELEAAQTQLTEATLESDRANTRVSDTLVELAAAKTELARITGTFGWRLLSRYGPIKYRFLLPAYKRIRQLLSGAKH